MVKRALKVNAACSLDHLIVGGDDRAFLRGILRSVKVFTTYYEGASLAGFIAALVSARIRMVADVRESPISRKPGFSKSALAQALNEAGIEYRHFRELGCPKPIRDQYREDEDWERYTRSYFGHLRKQTEAIDSLTSLSRTIQTALLCYEADFNRCHRTYVARVVADRAGALVCHITTGGLITEVAGSARAAGRSGSRSAIGRESDEWCPSGT